MARVRELRIRADWQVVRFVYLPAIAVGLTPFHLCSLCIFCSRWGHHIEEWIGRKPLFRITEAGLRYEDGGTPIEYGWPTITGIVLHRRNTIQFWKTDGDIGIASPRFWLAISMYEATKGETHTICIWPRQVVGGLFSLARFARELQSHLIERSERGEIPSLLPSKGNRA